MPLPPNTHTLTHTLTLSSSSWRPGFVVSVETVAVPSERAQCHLWQPAEPPPLTSAPLMHAATYFITTPTVSTAIAQPDERSAPLRSVHLDLPSWRWQGCAPWCEGKHTHTHTHTHTHAPGHSTEIGWCLAPWWPRVSWHTTTLLLLLLLLLLPLFLSFSPLWLSLLCVL